MIIRTNSIGAKLLRAVNSVRRILTKEQQHNLEVLFLNLDSELINITKTKEPCGWINMNCMFHNISHYISVTPVERDIIEKILLENITSYRYMFRQKNGQQTISGDIKLGNSPYMVFDGIKLNLESDFFYTANVSLIPMGSSSVLRIKYFNNESYHNAYNVKDANYNHINPEYDVCVNIFSNRFAKIIKSKQTRALEGTVIRMSKDSIALTKKIFTFVTSGQTINRGSIHITHNLASALDLDKNFIPNDEKSLIFFHEESTKTLHSECLDDQFCPGKLIVGQGSYGSNEFVDSIFVLPDNVDNDGFRHMFGNPYFYEQHSFIDTSVSCLMIRSEFIDSVNMILNSTLKNEPCESEAKNKIKTTTKLYKLKSNYQDLKASRYGKNVHPILLKDFESEADEFISRCEFESKIYHDYTMLKNTKWNRVYSIVVFVSIIIQIIISIYALK